MTREAFIKKWLANPNKEYSEQHRDEMRDDLDDVIKYAELRLSGVSNKDVAVCDHPDEAIIRDNRTDYFMACGKNIPEQTDC